MHRKFIGPNDVVSDLTLRQLLIGVGFTPSNWYIVLDRLTVAGL